MKKIPSFGKMRDGESKEKLNLWDRMKIARETLITYHPI